MIHFPRVSLVDPTIKDKPLQAEYEALLIDLLGNEKVLRKEYQKLYRDSVGRFRKDLYIEEFKEGKEPITIHISDPTKGKNFFMRSDNMTGKIINSDFLADGNVGNNQQLDVNMFNGVQPNQVIEQAENMTVVYLGEKYIEAMLCVGLKIIENNEHFSRKEDELWISTYSSELVEENLIEGNYKEIYKLYNISLLNPELFLFDPLKGYEMEDFVSSCRL